MHSECKTCINLNINCQGYNDNDVADDDIIWCADPVSSYPACEQCVGCGNLVPVSDLDDKGRCAECYHCHDTEFCESCRTFVSPDFFENGLCSSCSCIEDGHPK